MREVTGLKDETVMPWTGLKDETVMSEGLDWSFFRLVFLFQKTRLEGAIEKSEITLSLNFFGVLVWGAKAPLVFSRLIGPGSPRINSRNQE